MCFTEATEEFPGKREAGTVYVLEVGEKNEKVKSGETMVREGLPNQELGQDFEEKREFT